MKKVRSWINDDKSKSVCVICDKETNDLVRCKLPNVEGYESIYLVCKVCMVKNGYEVYDGSDWASDW